MNLTDLKKAVKIAAVVIVLICLLQIVSGIFNAYTFKQMLETKIRISGYGLIVSDSVRNKMSEHLNPNFIFLYISIGFILFELFHFFLVRLFKSNKIIVLIVVSICTAMMVSVIVFSILRVSDAFLALEDLPGFNSLYSYDKYYYDFTYLQMYQSATLSIFIPTLIVALIAVVNNVLYIVFGGLFSRKAEPEEKEMESCAQN